MKILNHEVLQLKESVFSTITQLANKHNAINLAQGFPDFDGPEWILELAQKSLLQQKNQYAPSRGTLALREAISQVYASFYDLHYRAADEILVTNGATEAIYCTIRALINPGDEVIAFEPLYDSYAAAVNLAQGQLKPVTLKYPDFQYDPMELLAQISDKTKLLILNNPHNPTGRVFSKQEIEQLADLAEKHDFYILSDEVYEHLSFNQPHQPTASVNRLKDRTITISSIGKTLSLTGWKVGWVCAPPALLNAIHNVHQFVCFCVIHPLQIAVAEALAQLPKYLVDFQQDYAQRKDLLVSGLKQLGFQITAPQGTYFVVAQVPSGFNDWSFSENLILNNQVATIPLSPFYLKSDEGKNLVRFCFAKKTETLNQALKNIERKGFRNA